MLIDSPLPELQIGLRFILPLMLGFAAVVLFLVRLAVRRPAPAGDDRHAGHGRRARSRAVGARPGQRSDAWRPTVRSGGRMSDRAHRRKGSRSRWWPSKGFTLRVRPVAPAARKELV